MEHRTNIRIAISIPATLFSARHGIARAWLRDLTPDGACASVPDHRFLANLHTKLAMVVDLGRSAPAGPMRLDAYVVRRTPDGLAMIFTDEQPEILEIVERIFRHASRGPVAGHDTAVVDAQPAYRAGARE